MALIELEDVRVAYGDLVALDGVSCAIEGGAVGLLGPNGAGKSTLIRTLLGFNRASSGRVSLFGKAMPRHALEVRLGIGYMPEREVSSPKVSAVNFLTYCGRLIGMSYLDAMERAHEALSYVRLGDSRYRLMETYSTGMLQRVKLAQALIHDPKLVLLDEPTNGLDPTGRIQMLDLIRDIAGRRGVAVLLSSHLLPDVQHVCDRVIMINNGRIVQEGRIDELTTPRDDLFEVRVRDREAVFCAALDRAGMVWKAERGGNLIVSPGNGAGTSEISNLKSQISEAARAAGTHIRHFRPVRRSLEEAFMDAVGRG
ncbi:MAG TPA: ABC transporter ATP-binding protein [Candidatus Hydrogenedentes bacterium]|nr:ABC transporter ATP-binding protein [Candidatus Hydrogenedentota bacterium]